MDELAINMHEVVVCTNNVDAEVEIIHAVQNYKAGKKLIPIVEWLHGRTPIFKLQISNDILLKARSLIYEKIARMPSKPPTRTSRFLRHVQKEERKQVLKPIANICNELLQEQYKQYFPQFVEEDELPVAKKRKLDSKVIAGYNDSDSESVVDTESESESESESFSKFRQYPDTLRLFDIVIPLEAFSIETFFQTTAIVQCYEYNNDVSIEDVYWIETNWLKYCYEYEDIALNQWRKDLLLSEKKDEALRKAKLSAYINKIDNHYEKKIAAVRQRHNDLRQRHEEQLERLNKQMRILEKERDERVRILQGTYISFVESSNM